MDMFFLPFLASMLVGYALLSMIDWQPCAWFMVLIAAWFASVNPALNYLATAAGFVVAACFYIYIALDCEEAAHPKAATIGRHT